MQKKDTLEKVIKCMDDGNIHRIFVVSGTIPKRCAHCGDLLGRQLLSAQLQSGCDWLWRRLDAQPPFALCHLHDQAEVKNGKPIPTHCISQRESAHKHVD